MNIGIFRYFTVVVGTGVSLYCGTAATSAQNACCTETGCQTVEDVDTCNMLGGIFMPGEDCNDGPCGIGACCTESSCVMTDAYSCIAAGRDFMGAGTDCSTDPCEQGTGACCIEGQCSILSPEDCAGAGGAFLGYGTICVGNPCDIGACCLPGACQDTVRHECDSQDGTFVAGFDCTMNPCYEPNDCPTNSLYSQSRDAPDYFTAFTSEGDPGYLRSDDFWGVRGPIDGVMWWGLDLRFSGGGFEECVETDNTFDISFYEDANGTPGTRLCTYTLIAACTPTGIEYLGAELNEYSVSFPEPCVLVNGWISIVGSGDPDCWHLWLSSRDGNELSYCDGCESALEYKDLTFCLLGSAGGVSGACCDDTTGDCGEDVDIIDCLGIDQRFVPNGACGDLIPPCGVLTGACCFDDESCLPLLTEAECLGQGGNWIGGGTNCVNEPCVRGSCCVVGEDCMEVLQAECDELGGVFTPGGGCIPDPCAQFDCPPDSLYSQSPDDPLGFNSLVSESSTGCVRYENFAGVAGPIEKVMWWGFDLEWAPPNWYECEEYDNTFEISFHQDAGGVPGAAVCSYSLKVQRTRTGVLYLGAELNEYAVTLPEPCVLVNGWISIVGLGDPDCRFLWLSSGDGSGLSFSEGCAEPWVSEDLSLCFIGPVGGVYGACCDDAGGVCDENVDIIDCLSAEQRFAPDGTCNDFEPDCGELTGACCWQDATCTVELEEDCLPAGGNWLGAFTPCSQCPCITPCPPVGLSEGEPVCYDEYVDIFNGGCDAETAAFSPIALCDTVCGESGVFLFEGSFTGDFDWYEIDVPVTTELTWTVEGEFPIGGWIVDGRLGCEFAYVIASNWRNECDPFSITALVEPGAYWLVSGAVIASDTAYCGAHYIAAATHSPICPGDFDNDGVVDLSNLAQLLSNYGTTADASYQDGDLDCDGDVDLADLAALLANYGVCGSIPARMQTDTNPDGGRLRLALEAEDALRPTCTEFSISSAPVIR